jgi:hypothetical protein
MVASRSRGHRYCGRRRFFCPSAKQPDSQRFLRPTAYWCLSAGGLTAALGGVTVVSVYISGRPDGRTLLGDIRSGVIQRAA